MQKKEEIIEKWKAKAIIAKQYRAKKGISLFNE